MFTLAFSLFACEPLEPAEYDYGIRLDDLELILHSRNVGIHPSTSVLDVPENPFSNAPLWDEKWVVEDAGFPPARFYGWATQLAVEPVGENQFYTARALDDCYQLGCVPSDQLYYVWQLAVDGYQAQLDHFPDGISYLADGETSFALSPLSYLAIEALGGSVEGWMMIEDEEGNAAVLPTGGEE